MATPTAIVTGASTGIGFQTARALARKGYRVIVATRNEKAGTEAVARITRELNTRPPALFDGEGGAPGGSVEFEWLDTSSLASVRAFAARFLQAGGPLHVLVCNAGISGIGLPKEARMTPESFETVFATNFLGHFLLVNLLLDALKATAAAQRATGGPPVRIVTLGSVTHRLVARAPDWGGVLVGQRQPGAPSQQYALSKLASMALAYHLQRTVLHGTGVTAIGVNPGGVASDIWRTVPPSTMRWLRPLMRWTFLTPLQGCATSVAAATASELEGYNLSQEGALLYLSPYRSPAWAQRWGGRVALLFDLLGRTDGAHVQRPTPLSLEAKVGAALWDTCTAALAAAPRL